MQYREFKPRPPLNRFIECYWTLEGETSSSVVQPERILPDGCVELILNFGAPFTQHDGEKRCVQPQHFVVGQMTGPILISPTGFVELIGIRFQPGGSLPFIQMQMHEVTDQVVELGGLSPGLERQLLGASTNLDAMEQRVSAVESVLFENLIRSKQKSWTLALAAKVVECRGLVSVDQLANEAGVSARQLERRFLSEVGLGPKLLSRIVRFQQVFRAVERCDGAWAPVAVECGYYDQAHLIRDFNQFAHQTPAVLFTQQSLLTESFTGKSRTSDLYNT